MKNKNLISGVSSIAIPLLLAFITSIILLVATGNPADTLFAGIFEVFISSDSIEALFKVFITPLLFTGVSVAFAFRGGLFNIGAEGQFIFGSTLGIVFAILVQGFLPPWLTLIVALFGGLLGGALMGAVPGILKAVFKVNEVVICIMMNYVAMYLSNFLISNMGPEAAGKNNVTYAVNSDVSQLISFGGIFRLDLFIAILVVVVFYIVINKTTFGYELRASGLNGDAADYAGMSVKRNVVLTMAISGAISGLGGVLYLFASTTVTSTQFAGFIGYGFTGIAVALLGLSTPVGVLLSAFLFGLLGQSGKAIATLYVPPISQQISAMVTALIVFFVSLQPKVKQYVETKLELRDAKKTAAQGGAK